MGTSNRFGTTWGWVYDYRILFFGVNYPFKWQHPSRVVTIYWYDGLSRFERAHLSYRKHLHIYGLKKNEWNKKKSPTHLQLIFTRLLHLTAYMHIQRRKWQTQRLYLISIPTKKKKVQIFSMGTLAKKKWTWGCPWGQIQFAKKWTQSGCKSRQ